MGLDNKLTVVALVNGMIGGIILVMPLLALDAGYFLILPATLIQGFFSYYSCFLCLRHLKHFKDLDESITYHFNNKKAYKVFYDIVIIISLTVLLILYFDLICQQWKGLTKETILIPFLNVLALLPIIYFLKIYDFGASLLGYGILSIIGYCIFLGWVQLTAPQGPRQLEPADKDFIEIVAALAQGFAIQSFFLPILMKNENKQAHFKLLIIVYVLGIAIYSFIGYTGALGIINRIPSVPNPETVEDFFEEKQWEVMAIEILYLIHLYSAFPQFLLVAKKRCFSIFSLATPKKTNWQELLYIIGTVALCLFIRISGLSLTVLVELNGAIISFFFIYLIPLGLHFKCLYSQNLQEERFEFNDDDSQKNTKEKEAQIQMAQVPKFQQQQFQPQNDFAQKNTDQQCIEKKDIENYSEKDSDPTDCKYSQGEHSQTSNNVECIRRFGNGILFYGQLLLLGIMLLSGLTIMVYTVVNIAIKNR